MSGVSDCLRWEHRPGVKWRFRNIEEGMALVDKFYGIDSNRKTTVEDALKVIGAPQPQDQNGPGVQVWTEPHGYYDGMWWSDDGPAQRGFLEGYISCVPNGKSLYPQPLDSYVEAINTWYSEDPPERIWEKVPIVLSKFKGNGVE